MSRISAVIVTRNNRRDIGRCLRSLAKSRRSVDEVIVIDQDSTDGTADYVRREFPSTTLLDFWDNPGFGEGNNRGARVASGDLLLLLNPDATVDERALDHLVAALEEDPQTGIAVPKVVLAAERSIINSAGLCVNAIGYGWDRGYLEWDRGQYDRPEPILAGSGCALLARRDLFHALEGFDAPYFLYYEDLDLCWRSWIMGRPVQFVPAAVVHHAMKVSGRPARYNEYLDHRNRLRTLLKNMSLRTLRRRARDVIAFEAGTVIDRARRKEWPSVRMRTRTWMWNLRRLPDTWSRRRAIQSRRVIADEQLAPMFVNGHEPRLKAALPAYRETYDDVVDRNQLAETLIMGANDVGALGLGWYGVESFDGAPSRWCCGYGIAYLAPPAGWTRATLRIQCVAVRPTQVVVRTDRVERGRFAVNPGPHNLEAALPINGDIVRVELLVTPTFVPSELNPASPDHRTLGVSIAALRLASCQS